VKLHSIIRTLAVAALVVVPAVASAEPNPGNNNGCPNGQWVNGQCVYNNNNNNGRWNNGNNNGRRDRDRDRNDNNNGYNNGYGNGYNNGYGNGRGGYGGGELNATVSSFSPYNLYLTNGMHVELHNGTIINPTGTTLRSGMRVRVMGNRNGDGTFNANEIDVVGNGYGYGNGGYRY
jgi:hypothetical protein